MSKPSIPKGTRDFTPAVMARRQWIFSTLRQAFEVRGFQPIETPAMEALATLTGKYGEEGDQLIFKLLNNGDFLAKAKEDTLAERDSKALSFKSPKRLCAMTSRCFARFVTMHRNDLPTFKGTRCKPSGVGTGPDGVAIKNLFNAMPTSLDPPACFANWNWCPCSTRR